MAGDSEAATRPGPSSCRGGIMIMLRCPRVLAPSLAQKAAMALRGLLWAALAAVAAPEGLGATGMLGDPHRDPTRVPQGKQGTLRLSR